MHKGGVIYTLKVLMNEFQEFVRESVVDSSFSSSHPAFGDSRPMSSSNFSRQMASSLSIHEFATTKSLHLIFFSLTHFQQQKAEST
jgi:hypothetical protein